MNKLIRRLAMAFVGISMAVGVGVAVGGHAEARMTEAVSPASFTLTFDQNTKSDGTGSHADADASASLTTVNFATAGTYSYSNSGTKYWILGGKDNINTPTTVSFVYPGKNQTIKVGKRASDGSLAFTIKGTSVSITSVVVRCYGDDYKDSPTYLTVSEASSYTVGGNTTSGKKATLTTSNADYSFNYSTINQNSVTITGGGGKGSNNPTVWVSQITVNYTQPTKVNQISLSGEDLGGTAAAATLAISSTDDSTHTIYATINDADDKVLGVAKTSGGDLVTLGGLTDGKITASGTPVRASFTVTGKGLSSGTNEVITITPHDGALVSATLTISVFDGALPDLVSVTVGGTPSKAIQIAGEEFVYTGLTFTAHFNNESTDSVSGEDIVWNSLIAGNNPTGKYTLRGVQVTVTVTSVEIIERLNKVSHMGEGEAAKVSFVVGTDTGATSVTKGDLTATMTTMDNASYYQIFASQSGTFSVAAGKGRITKIEFVCTASGTSKYGPGNASANVGTYSYSDDKGTWTGSATSITISTTAQIRMTSLDITYIPVQEIIYSNSNPVAQKAVLEFVAYFNEQLACNISGTSSAVAKWTAIATEFGTKRTASGEATAYNNLFKYANAAEVVDDGEGHGVTPVGDSLQKMLSKYDYVVDKYELTDFLSDAVNGAGRAAVSSAKIVPSANNSKTADSTILIIVVISTISLVAIAGYFVIRRRKENN